MSKIEISVAIDATNTAHVDAAIAFLTAVKGGTPSKVASPKPENTTQASKSPEKKEEDKKDSPSVSINEIRTLIQKKTKDPDKGDDNRKAIKDKLTEFGANNASTLKEENYEAFHEFLNTLG